MTPKDFLHHCIEQYILTPLTEAGFTYHKSKYSFTKTVGDFQQEIEFCKIGNTIDFYIKFKINSLKTFANYKKTNARRGNCRQFIDMLGTQTDAKLVLCHR